MKRYAIREQVWEVESGEWVKHTEAQAEIARLTHELADTHSGFRTVTAHLAAELDDEKQRRIYYQQIVYNVCNQIDAWLGLVCGTGGSTVCGTVGEPSTQVQERLAELLAQKRGAQPCDCNAKARECTAYETPRAKLLHAITLLSEALHEEEGK